MSNNRASNIQINSYSNYKQFSHKLMVNMPRLEEIAKELRFTAQYTQSHKLYHSSKWAGELLKGISSQQQIEKNFISQTYIYDKDYIDLNYQFNIKYQEIEDQSFDDLLIARSLFDLREFKKCAYVLKSYQNDSKFQSAIFLHTYSLFMAGEMKKEEEYYENEQTGRQALNPELSGLEKNLKKFYEKKELNDLNIYLYGLILKERNRKEEAKECFIECLNKFGCFWSAWLELCTLLSNEDFEEIIIKINNHWMKNFYVANYLLDKQQNYQDSIQMNVNLFVYFRNSSFIQNMIAHAFYSEQEFDNSLEWFENLVEKDPYRYENMDTYSNILYIKENQGELSNLAQRCFSNNKYTAETCCVVGNYYSLLGEHLKAILYFRKALKLDKNCQAAWTLMGHEYLEMKNVVGAIDAYRNATENDSSDFRAWYGLGQTYELQNMNHYALYYFSQAVLARPKDPRMWNALGGCYNKLEKVNESAKCFERADSCKDKECIALHSLAKLCDFIGDKEKAMLLFEKNYKRKESDYSCDKEWAESLLYVSIYYFNQKDYETSKQLATKLIEYQGCEREQANSLLIEIARILNSNSNHEHHYHTPNSNHILNQFTSNQVYVSNNLLKNTSNSQHYFN